MQVSTDEGGAPQKALDGSTAAAFSADTCTLTKPERMPWWYVNLLEPYMVQLVRLDFGKPCCGVNKPAVVVVRVGNNRPDLGTNPICNRYTGFLEEGQPLFLPCNPPMPGAFVSVHLETAVAGNSHARLSICEAFVYTDQALPVERCPQFRDQPPGSTATYNGKCYIFYDQQPADFRDALAFCRSRGGTLLDESNPALQGFVSWELWRRHRSDSSSQYWLGAVRDPLEPTSWKWVSGADVTVSFWNAPGGKEECARFDGSKGWLWADTDCSASLNYICQHQPKTCGRPEQPPNSTMNADSFAVGATVQYSCDPGHLLVGPTARTCLPTGFYDEFPPVCKHIECGLPAEVAHGGFELLNGSVSYLSHVQYWCGPGYEMAGRARLVSIQCAEPPTVANGHVTVTANNTSGPRAFGALVEYACAPGYRLVGARALTCLASAQWDQPPPHCRCHGRAYNNKYINININNNNDGGGEQHEPRTSRQHSAPAAADEAPRAAPDHRRRRAGHDTTSAGHDTTSAAPHGRHRPPPHHHERIRAASQQTPRVNVPQPVDGERREPLGPRLNIGAVVALGAFGALVFLIAIVTTVVILVKR
ncbi:unnamed protein product [Leptidea sinapis]|uniref:Sushi, von Willebrand factor type A, EGF and pentraxin domain-containing protein 1 n=1 Tax=Leptidea sinapis TaxID=189913 RepID=A0A5E4QSJ5_9NEOP|nr:unnamed protein product [Leptidea sinapis]